MSIKRLISIGLFALMLIGCSAQALPKAEPRVFSVLFNERKTAPFQKDWLILEEYKKRRDVSLNVSIGDDSAYGKAITQTFESGNIPDIVLKVYPDSVGSYAASGVLLPFSDYESQLPNFMAYIKEHNLQGELDKLRLPNGKYYILPGYQRQIQVQQWIYRRDIFAKNNLPIPTTYDELFNDLVTLKKIYPDSTPITAAWQGAHLFAMMGAGYGIPAGWAGTRFYNKAEDKWQFSPAMENYKALYAFLSRCYQAGILDPALFTHTDADYNAKLTDGRSLVGVTWITSGFAVWNNKLKENGFPDGEWAALPVPVSTIGIKALPAVDPFRKGLAVPARVINEPYFKDLLKFLDWAVYSEEGMTLTTWGIDGLTFKNTDQSKVYLPTIKTPKNASGTIDIAQTYGLDYLFNLNENEEFEDYKKPAEIVAFLNNSLTAKEARTMPPALKLDSNAIDAINLINEKINPYVTKSSQSFITGELNVEKDWDKYLMELEKLGYKTIEEIWNSAWQKQNQ